MWTNEAWDWIGIGTTLAGFAVVVVAVVSILRHGARVRRQPSPPAGRSPHDRRTPREGRDAGPGRRRLIVVLVGMTLVQVGQSVQHRSTIWTVLALVVVLLFGIGVVLLVRDTNRARRGGEPS